MKLKFHRLLEVMNSKKAPWISSRCFPAGDRTRTDTGLPPRDFHTTLCRHSRVRVV